MDPFRTALRSRLELAHHLAFFIKKDGDGLKSLQRLLRQSLTRTTTTTTTEATRSTTISSSEEESSLIQRLSSLRSASNFSAYDSEIHVAGMEGRNLTFQRRFKATFDPSLVSFDFSSSSSSSSTLPARTRTRRGIQVKMSVSGISLSQLETAISRVLLLRASSSSPASGCSFSVSSNSVGAFSRRTSTKLDLFIERKTDDEKQQEQEEEAEEKMEKNHQERDLIEFLRSPLFHLQLKDVISSSSSSSSSSVSTRIVSVSRVFPTAAERTPAASTSPNSSLLFSNSSPRCTFRLSNLRENAPSITHRVETGLFLNGFTNFFPPSRFSSTRANSLSPFKTYDAQILLRSGNFCEAAIVFYLSKLGGGGGNKNDSSSSSFSTSLPQEFNKELHRLLVRSHSSSSFSNNNNSRQFLELLLLSPSSTVPDARLLELLTSVSCLEWNLCATKALQKWKENPILLHHQEEEGEGEEENEQEDSFANFVQEKWELVENEKRQLIPPPSLFISSSSRSHDPMTLLMLDAFEKENFPWSSSSSSSSRQQHFPIINSFLRSRGLEEYFSPLLFSNNKKNPLIESRPLICFPKASSLKILKSNVSLNEEIEDDDDDENDEKDQGNNSKKQDTKSSMKMERGGAGGGGRREERARSRTTTTRHGIRSVQISMRIPSSSYLSSCLREITKLEN